MGSNRRQFLASVAALMTTKAAWTHATDDSVTVHTQSGVVRGRVAGDLRIFTGIPFGAPTGGPGRFRPPQPAGAWDGIFDATQPAKIPPQPTNFLFPTLPGVPSEDCLQLNIWAPKKPGRYPVLVWMYGGGNLQGSCVEPLFDCAPFARDGIVAVNFNYRLGALGFLELGGVLGPDYRGSANNAMRDQLLALQWVKRNISAFGGDPARITMAGQSAGAGNLIALLSGPASRGTLKGAIIASATSGAQEVETADAFAKVFVAQLGDISHLRTASFQEVLAAQGKALAGWPHGLPFRAIVDPKMMPSAPVEAVTAGSAREVALLLGWCHDETRTLISESDAGNPSYVPMTIAADPPKVRRVLEAYAKTYPDLPQSERVWKMTAAEIFVMPALRVADAQAAAGGRIHTYRLDYKVPNGPFGEKTPHGFDVPMVFGQMNSSVAKFFGFSAADARMAQTMHAVWSSFVRTGTAVADETLWPPYDLGTRRTMILDRRSHVEADLAHVDRELWAGT